MSGEAFEFTPMGVQPLAEPTPLGGVIPAGQAIAKMREQVAALERTRSPSGPTAGEAAARAILTAPPAAMTPGSLVKQIRARLRVIAAEIKKMKRLEREAAELRRLLAAAKAPPAGVSHITSARKSG